MLVVVAEAVGCHHRVSEVLDHVLVPEALNVILRARVLVEDVRCSVGVHSALAFDPPSGWSD